MNFVIKKLAAYHWLVYNTIAKATRADEMHVANPTDFLIVPDELMNEYMNEDGMTCDINSVNYTLLMKGEDVLEYVFLNS